MEIKNFNLNDSYNMWYHSDKNNWTIKGFKNILEIRNTMLLWQIINNWNIFINSNKHLFIMKNNIKPIWEDKPNSNGGCWSFKINHSIVLNVFEKLFINFVGKNILKSYDNDDINGISLCKKKIIIF